jgi:hypothetical protein
MKQERDNDKSRDNANRVNLEDAVDIVGTCDMMCPEFESLQRYFERDLDPFEKVRCIQVGKRELTGFPVSKWRIRP